MKDLKCNIIMKFVAVILSFFSIVGFALSGIGIAVMFYYDFYTNDYNSLNKSIMKNIADSETYNAYDKAVLDPSYADYYYSNKNFFVTVTDSFGETVFNNDKGAKRMATATDSIEKKLYIDKSGQTYDSGVVEYDGKQYRVFDYSQESEVIFVDPYEAYTYKVTVSIPQKMRYTDRVFLIYEAVKIGYKMRYAALFIVFISFVFAVASVGYLFVSAGHKKGCDTVTLNPFDKIPYDFRLVLLGAIYVIFVCSLCSVNNLIIALILIAGFGTVLYFLTLGYALSVATGFKTKTVFKNTLIYMLGSLMLKGLKKFFKVLGYFFKNLNTVAKTVIFLGLFFTADFIITLACVFNGSNEFLVFYTIVTTLAFALLIIGMSIGFKRLLGGSRKISKGALDEKIDEKYLYGDMKEMAENLNSIDDGLSLALDEKMKSERMKTELITNVSHDIKTPLTSIINYIDLIKKQGTDDDKLSEYVDILDRQAVRLKKLIEDLIEASKASSGALGVNIERCDLKIILTQILGEYDERLEKSDITPVINFPENSVNVLADGRHLWRVIDNLMGNICKYAMPSTRVYIDLDCRNGKAYMTFKNVSAKPLNISGDELCERFVRGDRSRNTEGSGLGLSIARSLTELQGGSLNIVIDGDLFKAEISFDEV